MTRYTIFLLILLTTWLLACTPRAPANPEGPTLGNIPLIPNATGLARDTMPNALLTIGQVHRETIDEDLIGYFQVDQPFLDTMEYYDDELERFQWTLVDVLQFGDGGAVRRYHRGQQRAILAFHPRGESTTDFMLLQGIIPP
ncbi:MAG: hypothetical protein H0T73_22715 [Ardenticatenales bacterium]|nr:hypothetical protein [Ardenticatenales bacterium]